MLSSAAVATSVVSQEQGAVFSKECLISSSDQFILMEETLDVLLQLFGGHYCKRKWVGSANATAAKS